MIPLVRQALLAGWLAFVYFALAASPGHFWLDAGEIGASAYELGVSHPPGAPGLALLLRAMTLVPIGSIGFRMAVGCALLGATVVVGVFVLLRTRGAHPWVSWGAVAWLVSGLTFVRHVRAVEIYALGGALLVVTLWGFDPQAPSARRTGRAAIATFAATWAAWCFGDLRLCLVPVVVVGWIMAGRRGRAWSRWAPLMVVLASAVVLCIPLASARGPRADWGAPRNLGAFIEHLSARSIRQAYADAILPRSASMWWHNASAFVEQMAETLGPLGPSLVGVGLVVLWLPLRGGAPDRSVAAALTFVMLVQCMFAIGINPMGIEDLQTGFAMVPLAALIVGEMLRRFVERRSRAFVWAVAPLCWTLLVVPAALRSLADAAVTRSWSPPSWTRAVLAQLPPGTLLLTQSDDLAAGTAYATVVDGARPDIASIPLQHLWRALPAAARHHEVAEPVWLAAARGEDERSRIALALAAAPGAVALEDAGTVMLAPFALWPAAGRPPLRIAGVDPADPHVAVPADTAAARWWSPRLESRLDRRRLGSALAQRARARVRYDVEGGTMHAISTLELVVSAIDSRTASNWVTLGALHDRAGDRDAAIAATREALRLEPDRPAALENLALYLSRDGAGRAEALRLAEYAVTLRPKRASGWERLAAVRQSSGDSQGADQARARALALRAENP